MRLHQLLPKKDYRVVKIADSSQNLSLHIGDIVQYDANSGVYCDGRNLHLSLKQCSQIEVLPVDDEVRLSDLRPGMAGKIVRVTGKAVVKQRLLEMGFTKGAIIRVIKEAPLGDPVEYEVRGYSLTLRRAETSHIFIEPLEEENK